MKLDLSKSNEKAQTVTDWRSIRPLIANENTWRGYRDFIAGHAFDADHRDRYSQIRYEEGRLLAASFLLERKKPAPPWPQWWKIPASIRGIMIHAGKKLEKQHATRRV